MEKEVRYYFSLNEEEKILSFLKRFDDLKFNGRMYEKTIQYDHPMEENTFYSKEIDGRFRLRIFKNDELSKLMITWKRRLGKTNVSDVNTEEEIEVRINPEDYNNQIALLENILKMKKIESYERYRSTFVNNEVEIAVDNYPFGIALEIESKADDSIGDDVVKKWVNNLGLKLEDSYKLSWDDKYRELCKENNMVQSNHVTFDTEVPFVKTTFDLK